MIRWFKSLFRRGCSDLTIARALDKFDKIPVPKQLEMPIEAHELADAIEKHLGGRRGYMSRVDGRREILNDDGAAHE